LSLKGSFLVFPARSLKFQKFQTKSKRKVDKWTYKGVKLFR